MYPSIIINQYLKKTHRDVKLPHCPQAMKLPIGAGNETAHRSPYRLGHRLIGSYYIYSSLPDGGAAAQMS